MDTLGLLEVTSIGIGYRAQDAMLKAADVDLLLARTHLFRQIPDRGGG